MAAAAADASVGWANPPDFVWCQLWATRALRTRDLAALACVCRAWRAAAGARAAEHGIELAGDGLPKSALDDEDPAFTAPFGEDLPQRVLDAFVVGRGWRLGGARLRWLRAPCYLVVSVEDADAIAAECPALEALDVSVALRTAACVQRAARARALAHGRAHLHLVVQSTEVGAALAANAAALRAAKSLAMPRWEGETDHTPDTMRAVLAALEQPACEIEFLDVSADDIIRDDALSSALQKNTSLRELIATGRFEAGDQLARTLSAAFAHPALTRLDLSANIIRTLGPVVRRVLSENRTLRALRLDECHARAAEVAEVCAGIAENTGLEEFSFSYIYDDATGTNTFNNEGAALMAAALGRNRTLRRLSLVYNGIGGDGAALLARSAGALTHLDLWGNVIPNARAEALRVAHPNVCLDERTDRPRFAHPFGVHPEWAGRR